MPALRTACTTALLLGATVVTPPTGATLREAASFVLRPLLLPFAWEAVQEASDRGDADEVFARGRHLMLLLPGWTDGHAVFAFRYVLRDEARGRSLAEQAAAAARRMDVALAYLHAARQSLRAAAGGQGRRELELIDMQTFLPEVACNVFPGLAEHLADRGGPEAIVAAYLAEAERLFPSAAVRERRTFHSPRLAAALLQQGAAGDALAVLDAAIARSRDVRDQALAAEWRDRLLEVTRWLRGDHTTDLRAVHADPRMAPLEPWLR